MAGSPIPSKLDELRDRAFSFYPPIVNVDHNEWVFKQSNWSEVLVENRKSGLEVWIPRAYMGDVSKVDEPVMIVGLKRELEYRGGSVWPFQRRVIEMPANPVTAMVPAGGDEAEVGRPSAIERLRMDSGAESGISKMIGIALAIGIAAAALFVFVYQQRTSNSRVEYKGVLQAELGLTSQSDYFDVVRKLGPPAEDRWKSDLGERQYRLLAYPKQNVVIILMGADRKSIHYIGAKDLDWKTVHSVELPGGRNTDSILRSLEKF